MLYTVAGPDWSPGRPLTPAAARGGLFRSRSEAGAIAAGRPTLAVALRYDATRGVVIPRGPAARAGVGSWAAPAVVAPGGCVTVLATIPAALVRLVGPAEVRAHPGTVGPVPRPHVVPGSPGVIRPPASHRLRLVRGGKPASSSGTLGATLRWLWGMMRTRHPRGGRARILAACRPTGPGPPCRGPSPGAVVSASSVIGFWHFRRDRRNVPTAGRKLDRGRELGPMAIHDDGPAAA